MCRLVTVTRSGIHRDPVTETVIVERPGPGTWHLVLQQLCSMAGQVGSGLHYLLTESHQFIFIERILECLSSSCLLQQKSVGYWWRPTVGSKHPNFM